MIMDLAVVCTPALAVWVHTHGIPAGLGGTKIVYPSAGAQLIAFCTSCALQELAVMVVPNVIEAQ